LIINYNYGNEITERSNLNGSFFKFGERGHNMAVLIFSAKAKFVGQLLYGKYNNVELINSSGEITKVMFIEGSGVNVIDGKQPILMQIFLGVYKIRYRWDGSTVTSNDFTVPAKQSIEVTLSGSFCEIGKIQAVQ
jgi:hypothetical protein